jgi:hypothetical protein
LRRRLPKRWIVNAPKTDSGKLKFQHTRLVLSLFGVLALGLAGLTWLNAKRTDDALAQLHARLCGELSAQVLQGLDTLTPNLQEAPDRARAAVSALQALPAGSSDTAETSAEARILFQSDAGWRELRSWSSELHWNTDPNLTNAEPKQCQVQNNDGRLRAVRSLTTPSGVSVLLVLDRLWR